MSRLRNQDRSFWGVASSINPGNRAAEIITNQRQTPDVVKVHEFYGDWTQRLKRARKFTGLAQKVPGAGEALEFLAEIPVDVAIGFTSLAHDISGELITIGGDAGNESYADYRRRVGAGPVYAPRNPVFDNTPPEQNRSSSSYAPTVVPLYPGQVDAPKTAIM